MEQSPVEFRVADLRALVRLHLGIRFCQPVAFPSGCSPQAALPCDAPALFHCMLEAPKPRERHSGYAGQLAQDDLVHHVLALVHVESSKADGAPDSPVEAAMRRFYPHSDLPGDREEGVALGVAAAWTPLSSVHGGILPLYARTRARLPTGEAVRIDLLRGPRESLRSLLSRASRPSAWDHVCVRGLQSMSPITLRELQLRFIFYQIVRTVAEGHKRRHFFGEALRPENIFVGADGWVFLLPVDPGDWRRAVEPSLLPNALESAPELPLERPPGYGRTITTKWARGEITNLEYLMALNTAAGRIAGHGFGRHPILPWVTDFKVPYGGWRDLKKSKYRITKGNEQLDSTYLHSTPPHHIPESLGSLTLSIYLARTLPMDELRRAVRANFVPEHYPTDVEHLFEWTPDECIPEFFLDPEVFKSKHKEQGLSDLALPAWVREFAAEEESSDAWAWFCDYHRQVLESEEVSANIHHWIDLNFGACLSGDHAIANMNVPLKLCRAGDVPGLDWGGGGWGSRLHLGGRKSDAGWTLHKTTEYGGSGEFVQLFTRHHPRRESLRHVSSSSGISTLQSVGEETVEDASSALQRQLMSTTLATQLSSLPTNIVGARSREHGHGDSSTTAGGSGIGTVDGIPRAESVSSVFSTLQAIENLPYRTQLEAEADRERLSVVTDRGEPYAEDSVTPASVVDDPSMFSLGPTNLPTAPRSEKRTFVKRVPGQSVPVDDNTLLRDMVQRLRLGANHFGSSGIPPEVTRELKRCLVPLERLEADSVFAFETSAFLDPQYEPPRDEPRETLGGDESESPVAVADVKKAADAFSLGIVLLELYRDWKHEPLSRKTMADACAHSGSYLPSSVAQRVPFAVAEAARGLLAQDAKERLVALDTVAQMAYFQPVPRNFLIHVNGGQTLSESDESAASTAEEEPDEIEDQGTNLRAPSAVDGLLEGGGIHGLPTLSLKRRDARGVAELVDFARRRRACVRAVKTHDSGATVLPDVGSIGSLFPPAYDLVHQYLHDMEQLPSTRPIDSVEVPCRPLQLTLAALPALSLLPVGPFTLMLPRIFRLLSEPKSFDPVLDGQSRHFFQQDSGRPYILDAITIFEDIGRKLGPSDAQTVLLPAICRLLDSMDESQWSILKPLMKSELWAVIISVAGSGAFLQQVLPILLNWLTQGLPKASRGLVDDLKVADVAKLEYDVVREAVTAIVSLTSADLLGLALCSRFVVPALIFRLSRAGSVLGLDTRSKRREHVWPPEDSVLRWIKKDDTERELQPFDFGQLLIEGRPAMIERALVEIGGQLGEATIGEWIIKPLLLRVIPELEPDLCPIPRPSAAVSFGQVLRVLSDFLSILSSKDVIHLFIDTPAIRVHDLLLTISLPPTKATRRRQASDAASQVTTLPTPPMSQRSFNEAGASTPKMESPASQTTTATLDNGESAYLEALEENEAQTGLRLRLHSEICRVVALVAQSIGTELSLFHVFPVVDKFFKVFIFHYAIPDAYRRVEASGGAETMISEGLTAPQEAVKMIRELFLALCTMVGPVKMASYAPYGAQHLPPLVGLDNAIVFETYRVALKRQETISAARPSLPQGAPSSTPFQSAIEQGIQWLQRQALPQAQPTASEELLESSKSPEVDAQRRAGRQLRATGATSTSGQGRPLPHAEASEVSEGEDPPLSLLEDWFDPDEGKAVAEVSHREDAGETPSTPNLLVDTAPGYGSDVGADSWPSPLQSSSREIRSKPKTEALKPTESGLSSTGINSVIESAFRSKQDAKKSFRGTDEDLSLRRDSDLAWLVGGGTGIHRSSERSGSDSASHASSGRSQVGEYSPRDIKRKSSLSTSKGQAEPASVQTPPGTPSQSSLSVEQAPWNRIGKLWTMHMITETSINAFEGVGGIRSLRCDPREKLLAAGAARGLVRIWNLSSHPPSLCSEYVGHHEAVNSIDFFHDSRRVISCDGALHVWDVESSKPLTVYNSYSSLLSGHRTSFTMVKVLSRGAGVNPGLGDAGSGAVDVESSIEEQQVLAATRSSLLHFDLRAKEHSVSSSGIFNANVSTPRSPTPQTHALDVLASCELRSLADWRVYRNRTVVGSTSLTASLGMSSVAGYPREDLSLLSSSYEVPTPKTASSSFPFVETELNDLPTPPPGRYPGIQCFCESVAGMWVCAGGSDGTCWVADWRSGQPLHVWKAHDNFPVVQVAALSATQLLTVSMDRTAVVWDLRGQPTPEALASVTGLPDAQGGMLPSTVKVIPTMASTPQRSPGVIFAFSGHKIAAGILPKPGCPPEAVQQTYLRNASGQRVRKNLLTISSTELLPMRRLLVLGCEDGLLRVCV